MKYLKLFEEWNINESLSTAREKYLITNQISPEEFNLIKNLDPSKNFKYVEKMIDVYLKDSPDIQELGKVFKDFDEMSKKNQIKNPDITSYRSFSEIVDTTQKTFSEYKEKLETKAKANEIDVVYEDDKVLVLIPRTHEATCKYGSGTKWCITEEDPKHYFSYLRKSITHYFVIIKGLPMDDPNYKMAVSVTEGGVFVCNDALDKRIPLEKVLEISGLDRGLFVSNPTPPTLDMKLLNASQKGDVEEVKKLIDAGANLDIQDYYYGESPLHRAVERDNKALVELLISAGADLDIQDKRDRSPLHIAVDRNDVALAELLISAGANLDIQDDFGMSPLNYAVYRDNEALAELLISAGADVDSKDDNGYSPLIWAVYMNNVALAKLLISAGAKVNVKDNWDESPLHVAVGRGYVEIETLLKKHGAVE